MVVGGSSQVKFAVRNRRYFSVALMEKLISFRYFLSLFQFADKFSCKLQRDFF